MLWQFTDGIILLRKKYFLKKFLFYIYSFLFASIVNLSIRITFCPGGELLTALRNNLTHCAKRTHSI